MSYIRKIIPLLVIGVSTADIEGSGSGEEETQIEETPTAQLTNEPFNCWSCRASESFDACLAEGRKEYCTDGKHKGLKH